LCKKKIAKLYNLKEGLQNEISITLEKWKIIRFMKEVCPGEVRRECRYYKILNGIYPHND
jgi:hypothetical protein